MDGYGYSHPRSYPPMQMQQMGGNYPDRGDGMGDYYGSMKEEVGGRRSRSKHRLRRHDTNRSRSSDRSKSRSKSRSRSRSVSRSLSRTRTVTSSGSKKDLQMKEPGFWDAFKVLYLTPSKHKKNTPKYLATKKRQDRIQELMKRDGLGSKRWLMYPRTEIRSVQDVTPRENCDQRIKVDGDYLRKCKKKKKIDSDAPIAKLKRWELLLYEKMGFIQAV